MGPEHKTDAEAIAAWNARSPLDQATLEAVARVRACRALIDIEPADLRTILDALQP